jgi:O-antigen/teichoic acid export membrane protein
MTRTGRAAFWAYALQIGGLPLSAILLPLLLWRFSMEELALWYLMQNIGQLAAIAEGALEPVLTRYLTYARSGIDRWPRLGEVPGPASGQENVELVQEAVSATRWLYGAMSGVNLALFGGAGALLLNHLGAPVGDAAQILTAWGLCCLAQALGTRWMAAIPLLQGDGRADAAFRALAIQRLVLGGVVCLGLICFGRLEVLGLAQLAAACAGLWPAMWLARRRRPSLPRAPGRSLGQALWHGSAALWLSRIGGYLVVRANLPIASAALGLGLAGRLALTMQLIEVMTQVANAPMFASLPRLYELRVRGLSASAITIVGRVLLAGWLTFIAGAVVLLGLGSDLLAWLGKPDALLATAPLALMLAGGLLELNFSMSATLLMVGNRVPFVFASLVSGVVAVSLNTLLLVLGNAGLMTLISVPLIVQATYNYWKWPRECLILFQTNYVALLVAARRSM